MGQAWHGRVSRLDYAFSNATPFDLSRVEFDTGSHVQFDIDSPHQSMLKLGFVGFLYIADVGTLCIDAAVTFFVVVMATGTVTAIQPCSLWR
jgi:hypothetical protein